jgi:hypothetical protein
MGNCFGVQDAKTLAVQIQVEEKEKEITRMKVTLMAKDRIMLQDSQEMQEVSKLRELLLLNKLRELGQERSSLRTKNDQLFLLNGQLARNLNTEKMLNASLKQL